MNKNNNYKNPSNDNLLKSNFLYNEYLEKEIVRRFKEYINSNFENGIPYEDVKKNIDKKLKQFIKEHSSK